jgi:PAS domain S-box-containing protein
MFEIDFIHLKTMNSFAEKNIQLLVFSGSPGDTVEICQHVERLSLSFDLQVAKNHKDYVKKILKYKPSVVIVNHPPGNYTAEEAYEDFRKVLPLAFFILVVENYSKAEMRNYSLTGIDSFVSRGDYSLLELIIMHGFNKKHLEKTMRQSQQLMLENLNRLRSVFNNDQNAIFIINFKNEIVDLNPSAVVFLGKKNFDEVVGTSIYAFISKQDLKKIRTAHAAAFRGKKTADEYNFSKKSGRHAAVNFVPIRNDEGIVVSVMLICKDITEAHLLREKYELSEERYYTLAEHAPVAIYHSDAEGNCSFVNKKWTEYTGLSLKASLGKGWTKAVHPKDVKGLADIIEQNRDSMSGYSADFRVVHASGKISLLRGEASPILDQRGNKLGFIGTITDHSGKNLQPAESGNAKESAF